MKFLEAGEYQYICIQRFEHYRAEILKLVPHARVEHIGASSIPNAVSKGDLDIFVGVDKTQLEFAAEVLKQLNFREKHDTLRTAELCMLESLNGDDVALQVVASGSEFEFFIAFRDTLRAEPGFVARYNDLKRSCAGMAPDEYRKKKSEFIVQVVEKA